MKINRSDLVNLINKIYKRQQAHDKAGTAASGASPGSDRLEISSLSEILKKEIARLEEKDPVREEKLARLSHQIETGTYKINAEELAAIMLQDPQGKGGASR